MPTMKKIRIDYYRIVFRPIQEKDLHSTPLDGFDFHKWLRLFDDEYKSLDTRIKPYVGDNIRLDYINYNEFNKLWELSFIRLRSNNLPRWAYNNQESKDIELNDDEYIGEDVCMLYDSENSVICLQRNRNSVSKNGIVAYINQIWDHRDGYVIDFVPIIKAFDITKGRKGISRKLHIKCSVAKEDLSSCRSLQQMIDTCNDIGGQTIDITISAGRSPKNRLNNSVVFDTIMALTGNSNCKSLQLSYKKDEESPVEYVDLLNCSVVDQIDVEIIPKKTISYHMILKRMEEQYILKKGLI